MAIPPSLHGPGLLYVNSRILDPSLLSEFAFLQWYSHDHIPEIIATSGVSSAFRFKTLSPDSPQPYLALYPLKDVAFLQSEEFKKIRVNSDLLPGGGPVYDLAEFDTRYYELVQRLGTREELGEWEVKILIVAGYEFENEEIKEDFDKWCRTEHIENVSRCPGYLRTTRFKLKFHRSNAQSRALKSLPPKEGDTEFQSPASCLALHVFDVEPSKVQELFPEFMKASDTPRAKKVLGAATKQDLHVFSFVESYGDGKFFG